MRSFKLLPALFCLSLLATGGCDLFEEGDADETSPDTGAPVSTETSDTDTTTSPTDTDTDTEDTDTTTPTTTELGSGWRITYHPCFGNRTDALLLEDGGDTIWVGCGTTTTGYGLFHSDNGGLTWSEPATSPTGFLENFRINTITRSDDGQLYVGGINTVGSERVVSLDTSGAQPYPLAEVFTSAGQLWNIFQAGSFARNASGFAVAESLTGVDLAFRTADDQPWQDGYGWWGGGGGYQILDMVLHDDAFYGCGSTISTPPMVFLPPPGGMGDDFSLVPVQLSTGLGEFSGEMWSLDADDDGLVVAGVNQERNVGMIYTGPLDGYSAADWTAFDVSTLAPNEATWMRGACRNNGTIVAVGEYSIKAEGMILISTDGGATFTDETPSGYGTVPPVHRCEILDDGRIAIAGADGWFGLYTP